MATTVIFKNKMLMIIITTTTGHLSSCFSVFTNFYLENLLHSNEKNKMDFKF